MRAKGEWGVTANGYGNLIRNFKEHIFDSEIYFQRSISKESIELNMYDKVVYATLFAIVRNVLILRNIMQPLQIMKICTDLEKDPKHV